MASVRWSVTIVFGRIRPRDITRTSHCQDSNWVKKVKHSHNTPMKVQGGEEVQLVLIHDLDTRWGEWSASRPRRTLPPGKGPAVPNGQEAW
jgi:hypothetical protein